MNKDVLLLDLEAGGHHGYYLTLIVNEWRERESGCHLHVVVGKNYRKVHPDLCESVDSMSDATLHVDDNAIVAEMPVVERNKLNSATLAKYVQSLGVSHAQLQVFDHAQIALWRGLRFNRDISLSGIYFRPSFHYGTLGGPPQTWRNRVQGFRKKLVLRAALGNPHLRHLFCTDPYVVPWIQSVARHTTAQWLPEPTTVYPAGGGRGSALYAPAEPHRKKLLIAGVLDERKGILQVCEALRRLTPAEQSQLVLALAGPFSGFQKTVLSSAAAQLRTTSAAQILTNDRYIPDSEVQQLVSESDLLLVTYQPPHLGTSNVLIKAASAGIPVISTDYGLVGAQVRRRRLGASIDAANPVAIANSISSWLASPGEMNFDPQEAAKFASENTDQAFANTIINTLLPHTAVKTYV